MALYGNLPAGQKVEVLQENLGFPHAAVDGGFYALCSIDCRIIRRHLFLCGELTLTWNPIVGHFLL